MIAYCVFETLTAGSVCPNCDQPPLTRDYKIAPRRQCKRSERCQFLGEKVGSVKVTCNGCSGKQKQVQQAAYQCDIWDRCLPCYKPTGEVLATWQERKPESDIYHLCNCCEERSPAEQPADEA